MNFRKEIIDAAKKKKKCKGCSMHIFDLFSEKLLSLKKKIRFDYYNRFAPI